MDSLLLYLLKVSAGTTLFYLCYLLLFRKDTFYLRNRIFLILTLLLPTILPAIKIPNLSNSHAPAGPANVIDNIIFSGTATGTAISGTINSFDYNRLFVWIYFIVTGLLLLRGAVSLISTYRIIKKGSVKNSRFPKVIISDNQLPPFSFFPYAVIPAEYFKNGNYSDILDHEFAHIREGHTFDLLLSELFIALQWFNPFVWLIKRSIILNHEYLADHVSLSNNKSVKEYQYRLLNFQTELKHISLAHSFNSLIKNRIIMINRKPTRRYATLKNILILPVAAIVVYAFATPEYHYVAPATDPLTINQNSAIIQNEVKGIVLGEDGKPVVLVTIIVAFPGNTPTNIGVQSGSDGRFVLNNIQKDASLLVSGIGYKDQILKPDFTSEMVIKMVKDPNYKQGVRTRDASYYHEGENVKIRMTDDTNLQSLIVIDEKISNYKGEITLKRDDVGLVKVLKGKEATDKYGEKGKDGVIEIITKKRAAELGLNTSPPASMLRQTRDPYDFPTFQGGDLLAFQEWVASTVKYPAEASNRKVEGWVSVNYTINTDGSISNIASGLPVNSLLSDEVIRVIKSSPKWEPPKNKDTGKPFNSSVTLKFILPDQIIKDAPFVVVEQMPMHEGGDMELLNFIKNNTNYPEEAKAKKTEGTVIIRFIISTEGKAEGVTVLKGVDPLLDAEALRIGYMLTRFKPGMQGGKPVNVWFMVPVNFSLSKPEPPK
jgi:TonB family protein